ncbi:hypothetical protein GM160_07200 [Guyparkeria halophila]|uniref:Uncharacterized protein n=1 Tax=Guyparkeria halophila TaxID=47960 RepID=A0A6I6D5L9_9GAMM|nr:hypothetical protein [Guyparkeria halophila]QGT78701.1 hypothetical protein GM160_07200 [Guyparkeria halophila]
MNRIVTGRTALKGSVLAGLVLLAGCAVTGPGGDQRTVIVHPAGDTSLDPVTIPAGHMPPPGECRIWYPDRSPGDQPSPGSCRDLEHRVPAGAVLVRG